MVTNTYSSILTCNNNILNSSQNNLIFNDPGLLNGNIPQTVDEINKVLDERLNKLKEERKYLEEQKKFLEEGLIFLIPPGEDGNEYQEWCFENNFIFMISYERLLDVSYQVLRFKNESDAMAFKLRWT